MNSTEQPFITCPQDYAFSADGENSLLLDCGRTLHNVSLRYECAGTLNEDRSNAILVTHALSGDAHFCGRHAADDRKNGWWDDMIGPGKYVDTNRYFVVCSNVIGGCSGSTGPRSVDPATGKRYNMAFPVITIADMVRAQHRLMKFLNIPKWLAVIGGSMGGMQVLEWSVLYPDEVQSAIPIATTAQLSPQSIAFDWVGREAIQYDSNWKNGDYEEHVPDHGLATARMLAHITYLSDESMAQKFGRNLQDSDAYNFNFSRDFAVESYLEHQGRRFVERFDACSYCYITRAMDYFDMAARSGGSLAKALSAATADFLVVSFSSDWLFPTAQSRDIVNALLQNQRNVSFCEIESSYGHDAFLLEFDALGAMVRGFLANQQKRGGAK